MTTTKLQLIEDIAQFCYDETESWSHDDIGLHLAYLFWAIAADTRIDYHEPLATLLRRNESLWDRVKEYVDNEHES
jgi:hypothetical protein